MDTFSCKKCLTGRTGDKEGDKCSTPGCDGIITRDPTWVELTDPIFEMMTCGSRMRQFGPWEHKEKLDHWDQFKTNKQRVCSFCGSLHFDDFHTLVKLAATAPEDGDYLTTVSIELADNKDYKVYVHQPEVRNAHEGGIKFYMWHIPKDDSGNSLVTEEQQNEFKEAVRRSNKRFEIYLNNLKFQNRTRFTEQASLQSGGEEKAVN